ncbi:MAG: protein-glutamate O-methyltransferase CheR [Rhodospirillaceae bacterium]|nr:protein-glutamate O-methyltransferase CheR [Rhodospirillaceae bacterium]
MNASDLDVIARLVKDRSGIVLTPDKAYLVESRLLPVLRRWEFASLRDLVASLRDQPPEGLIDQVVEAMTTNETSFFRDLRPFEQLRDVVLPGLMKARAHMRSIRIWSAACSSGQEPYSIAMMLCEMAGLAGWKVEIVATDISHEMLERAEQGIYTQFEVQRGVDVRTLIKYFQQSADRWHILPRVRRYVTFRPFNLLHDPVVLGRFDIVFCRNVLIYFDQPTKALVLERIAQQMPEDGVLFLGGAETVLGVTDAFRPVKGQRGLYAPARPAPQAAWWHQGETAERPALV